MVHEKSKIEHRSSNISHPGENVAHAQPSVSHEVIQFPPEMVENWWRYGGELVTK